MRAPGSSCGTTKLTKTRKHTHSPVRVRRHATWHGAKQTVRMTIRPSFYREKIGGRRWRRQRWRGAWSDWRLPAMLHNEINWGKRGDVLHQLAAICVFFSFFLFHSSRTQPWQSNPEPVTMSSCFNSFFKWFIMLIASGNIHTQSVGRKDFKAPVLNRRTAPLKRRQRPSAVNQTRISQEALVLSGER